MASEIRFYVEGDKKLKRGFSAFLKDLAELARKRQVGWRLVIGGTRNDTLADFALALRKHDTAFNVLLVDSEGPVDAQSPWEHLDSQISTRLSKPETATDDQAHLMVQAMESWFLADRDALQKYYCQGFLVGRLPDRQIEDVPKSDLESMLRSATEGTQKGKYHKTRHAPDLLGMIDPAKVRSASPWCDRLFATIERVIEAD